MLHKMIFYHWIKKKLKTIVKNTCYEIGQPDFYVRPKYRVAPTTQNLKGFVMQVLKFCYLLVSMVFLTYCSTDEQITTSGSIAPDAHDYIEIETLSTKPWLVTGGDVLLEVRVNPVLDIKLLNYSINGRDVSSLFRSVTPSSSQALLEGLPIGQSELLVFSSEKNYTKALTLTNYPISGPIISGPHEKPFLCETDVFDKVSGGALPKSMDEHCSVETQVEYVYWSYTDDTYKNWQPTYEINPPSDLGYISIRDVGFKPFVVRVETGVVNRAIYEIALLHDEVNEQLDPWTKSDHWNGKLVYTHGGGCRRGWFRQGNRTGGVMRRELFELGFAVVSSSLNVFGQNCNDLLASETHIMVKERFIEHYGVPNYTVATGTSGGSYQSHQTADNYPGVFDGIIVGASFPDVTSATIFSVADARLLHHYFTEVDPEGFSKEQQRIVSGFGVWESIPNLSRGAARLDPLYDPSESLEEQGGEVGDIDLEKRRYSLSNSQGFRPTVYDHAVNVYNRVPNELQSQRPLDNVGVQYGLRALNQHLISPRQFIDLNRDIGGFDRDMNHIAARHKSDAQAAKRAIESGRILSGGGGLASTAIIDYRNYMDHDTQGNIHMLIHQFSTRERLIKANGHADNQVMQIGGGWGLEESDNSLRGLFEAMDEWLLEIKSDQRDLTLEEKVVDNRPLTLNDACWHESDGAFIKIEELQTFRGDSRCNDLYPAYLTPRHVAGAPLSNDIVTCQLRPLSPSDYGVGFTPDQYRELEAIFPSGVCDWTLGDASQTSLQSTWISFGPSPVNVLYEQNK